MSEEKKEDIEELREVLSVVSKEVPALIKGLIGSVFSEEAGKNMGKAAAAFYKELKEAGMPEETAIRMTENYVSVFTDLGEMMKKAVSEGKIKEKLAEKHREEKEED